jgi:hypothetical protein
MPWLRSASVNLAYHITTLTGTVVVWDGMRTPLTQDVQPGQSLALAATVKAPTGAGIYTVTFDLVQEGVTWFSSQSIAGAAVNLIVQ